MKQNFRALIITWVFALFLFVLLGGGAFGLTIIDVAESTVPNGTDLNLSGTNTGDQDLSDYLKKDGTVMMTGTLNTSAHGFSFETVENPTSAQPYKLVDADGIPVWQGQTSNKGSYWGIISKDGDGDTVSGFYSAKYGTTLGDINTLTSASNALFYQVTGTTASIFTFNVGDTGIFPKLPLIIYTSGNSNQLYLNTNGNVGIGKVPSAGYGLDVNGNVKVGGSLTATDYPFYDSYIYGNNIFIDDYYGDISATYILAETISAGKSFITTSDPEIEVFSKINWSRALQLDLDVPYEKKGLSIFFDGNSEIHWNSISGDYYVTNFQGEVIETGNKESLGYIGNEITFDYKNNTYYFGNHTNKTYLETYQLGKSYIIGDKFIYNNLPYEVIQAHTSQSSWKPDITKSLYKIKITPQNGVIPDWVQPTGAHDCYAKDDQVKYLNEIYTNNIECNVYAPNIYGWTKQ